MKRPKQRLTSIAITARLDGGYRVAIFPRVGGDMTTMPQDYPTKAEAEAYAAALHRRTGWHVVDRTGARDQSSAGAGDRTAAPPPFQKSQQFPKPKETI